jgi:ketosteroid isomerase-like protein
MKSCNRFNLTTVSILIFLCVIIIFSGFQAFGAEWTTEQKEVWDATLADVELFKKGDVEKIMGNRHEDMVVWWNDNSLPFDKELAPYKYNDWFNYDIPKNWELKPITIKISGNIAIIAYTYKFSGEILSGSGRNIEVWVKQNNKWLLLSSTGASCEKSAKCQ